MIGYLILFLSFILLFLLSFYFGFREWRHPQDDKPLPVDVEYVRVENYFGTSFRAKMQEWLESARSVEVSDLQPPVEAVLEKANGERILLLNGGTFGGDTEHDELVCCEGDLTLADRSVFLREIYSRGKVETGAGVQLQALAADGEVTLGLDNDVSRWVDAYGKIWLRRGTVVHSRVSSQDSIQLDLGVSAQSLYAPLVFTAGYRPTANYPILEEEETKIRAQQDAGKKELEILPPTVSRLAADTLLVRGDLELKPGSRVDSNLVVQGTLRSGVGCVFRGDVKAGSVQLGPRNQLDRNLVSGSSAQVGDSSFVARAVVAETDVVLGPGCRVGQPGKLAVVTAGREVKLEQDVGVWGKVAAGRAILTI